MPRTTIQGEVETSHEVFFFKVDGVGDISGYQPESTSLSFLAGLIWLLGNELRVVQEWLMNKAISESWKLMDAPLNLGSE